MPYLVWIHAAVIIVFIAATFRLRRLSSRSPTGAIPSFRAIFAPWLIATGVAALAVAGPNWTDTPLTGSLWSSNGASAGGVNWHGSNGHYYLRSGQAPEREISKAEYEQFERASYSVFARAWVLFCFIALCLWHVAVLREQPVASGAAPRMAGEPGASAPATSAALDPAASGPRSGGSTLAIVGIWSAVLASGMVPFARPVDPTMCSAEFQPAIVVALLPFVVFGLAAIRARQSPFYSTWIAQIMDARYGLKAYETFLVRLKPTLLFGVEAFAIAAATTHQCGKSLTDFYQSMPATFFASGGAALVMMHLVMRWRKVPGV